jgi:hypothetical protein
MPWRRMVEWSYSSTILDLGTRWRRVVSFTPSGFTSGERAPGTHWIGSWLVPGPVWTLGVEKNLLPLPGIETPTVQPVGRQGTDWAIPARLIVILIKLIAEAISDETGAVKRPLEEFRFHTWAALYKEDGTWGWLLIYIQCRGLKYAECNLTLSWCVAASKE